jgi:cytoskeletal protein CcmA (bactofilin family)
VEKTVIGSSFVIEGDLECAEALEVHGRVRGKSVSARSVTVLASGSVEAEVKGETVRVEGAVVGTISAGSRVEIAPDARMEGDIRSPRIVIADGAHFRGNVDMSR